MDDHRLGDSIREFLNRRHPDGGYTLFEELPDTKNTYYALRSFELLGDEPGLEDPDWLEDVHRGELRRTLQVQCAEGLWQGLFSVR